MQNHIELTYTALSCALQQTNLNITPPELHGLLTGMICGGLSPQSNDWQPMLYDFTTDGAPWSDSDRMIAETLHAQAVFDLGGDSLALYMPLAEDDIRERTDSLIEWISHFMSGMGLMSFATDALSDEGTEALSDLSDISKLALDEDDDIDENDIESMIESIIEHVKVCVLTLHTDLGSGQHAATVH